MIYTAKHKSHIESQGPCTEVMRYKIYKSVLTEEHSRLAHAVKEIDGKKGKHCKCRKCQILIILLHLILN